MIWGTALGPEQDQDHGQDVEEDLLGGQGPYHSQDAEEDQDQDKYPKPRLGLNLGLIQLPGKGR